MVLLKRAGLWPWPPSNDHSINVDNIASGSGVLVTRIDNLERMLPLFKVESREDPLLPHQRRAVCADDLHEDAIEVDRGGAMLSALVPEPLDPNPGKREGHACSRFCSRAKSLLDIR